MTPFRFRASARQDIDEAGATYLSEYKAGIETSFFSALENTIVLLRQKAFAGSTCMAQDAAQHSPRCWPLKGFPYIVFYTIGLRGIQVTRVLHTPRDIPATLRD